MAKKFIEHDLDSFRDVKIGKMVADYGIAGYGYYWILVEILAGNGGRCVFADLGTIANSYRIDKKKLRTFINQCCERYTHNGKSLLKCDNEAFWSESLLRRLAKKEKTEKAVFMQLEDVKCVHLVEEDYTKLCDKYGRNVIDTGIKILDGWLSLGGAKAKSYLGKNYNHIGHFRSDGWVINEAKRKLATAIHKEVPTQEELIRKLNLCR